MRHRRTFLHLERDFDDFDTEAEKFLDGETKEAAFIGFRLKQGVYGQLKPVVQMIRIALASRSMRPTSV